MKSRIINQLNGIANSDRQSDTYLQKIKENEEIIGLGINDEEIRKRAGLALTNILHDYSRFRIETIDSFFQSVVRELAHELDLTANLRVDLNSDEVLTEAVNEIIDDLKSDKHIFKIIESYIEEKTERKKGNWRINREIEDFGKNIFNEHYLEKNREIREKIGDTKFLSVYKKNLNTIREKATEELRNVGKEFLDICGRNGYDSNSFKYANSGIYNFFVKLSNEELAEPGIRVLNCAENEDNWLKDKNDTKLRTLVRERFMPSLNSIIQSIPEWKIKINTTNAILKHINHLMLLNIINTKVRYLNQEANRFLLKDTAHFLNDLIDKSDIPFVYEKMGARFNHIMIDEFQDTSKLQWENFKPLLSNSLDSNYDCLIVGDVKQSIYRWRFSEWQILNNIENSQFKKYTHCISLDTNFRSAERVITFNNMFFTKAVTLLSEDSKDINGEKSEDLPNAYRDVCQKFRQDRDGKGFVSVTTITAENDEEYSEKTLKELAITLRNLLDNGVRQNDITIIVRTNNKIPLICKYFNDLNAMDENTRMAYTGKHEIKIISNEAFRLDFSATVNIIITAFRFLTNKKDRLSLANLAYYYQKEVKRNEDIRNSLSDFMLKDRDTLLTYLPEAFTSNIEKLTYLPIMELAEQVYNLLELENIKHQDAYLFYFHDKLSAYCEDQQTDLYSFLTFWDETLHEKTIANDSANGVRIMSIHKSKGLEFHTVIMPYCNWDTNGNSRNLLWCTPQVPPYDELPLAPVDFTKETKESIFCNDYLEEELKNDVDNLNLLYVGFTRAVSNLIILTKSEKEKKQKKDSSGREIKNVSQIILRSIPEDMEHIDNQEDMTETWSWGHMSKSKKEDSLSCDNITSKFCYHDTLVNYRQSNNSKKFILSPDETTSHTQTLIDRGLLYHNILQKIKTTEDIDSEIDKVIDTFDGMGCFETYAQKTEASKHLHEAFTNDMVRDWFNTKWEVLNERAILYKDDNGRVTEKRPDRVISSLNRDTAIVIDYKTGEEHKNAHTKQIKTYMGLLERMGYKNVKGYIWYVLDGKIEEYSH